MREKHAAERQDQIFQLDSEHGLSIQGGGQGALYKLLPAHSESPSLWHTSRAQVQEQSRVG